MPDDDPTGGSAARTIRALRDSSNQAIARHDTAGIGAVLAPNVVVVASTSTVTVSRDGNTRAFAEIFAARPDVSYRRTPLEITVEPRWKMAAEEGEWVGRWTAADGPVAISGRYFAKWRVIGGEWLIESETFVATRCEGGRYCAEAPR